jgi:hypothetical protein
MVQEYQNKPSNVGLHHYEGEILAAEEREMEICM